MRRRSSPKVVWLPTVAGNLIDEAGLAHSTVQSTILTILGDPGDGDTVVIPITRDATPNPLTPTATLADLYSSGYRLRRIVGKFWCAWTTPPSDTPGAVTRALVKAGFIILRTDDAGLPLNQTNITAYGPGIIENDEAPWIWQRSWMMHSDIDMSATLTGGNGSFVPGFAVNNYSIGGNADGPHIDQKTARIVGPDERLFIVIQGINLDGAAQGLQRTIVCHWETRVLASIRANIGNRRNASR